MNTSQVTLTAMIVCAAMTFACTAHSDSTAQPLITQPIEAEQQLLFYNWIEYIAPNTLKQFEKKTGIKTIYNIYDSNEVLQGKLLSGKSGFDLVCPSHDFYKSQIQTGVFSKLDRSLMPNWKNLDPVIMKKISDTIDEDNQYGIPYLWGTTGIGYNKKIIEQVLGKNAPIDSWALVFDPENMKKLQQYGIAFLDAPTEILPSVLTYLNRPSDSLNIQDYQAAVEQLLKVRPYISYFHSAKAIADLANGDICIAIGWSGDMLMAKERAKEAKNGIDIHYSIPKEGAAMWFDMLAIPTDASHKKAAHAMLNYMMEPTTIADISNFISYANPIPSSKPFLNSLIANNPSIYPPRSIMDRLFILKDLPATYKKGEHNLKRYISQQWRRIMTGNIDSRG